MEADRVYGYRNLMGDLNQEGMLKPYGYLKLLNQLVEEHFEVLGLSQNKAMEHRLAWILISAVFLIIRPVRGTGRVFGGTWYSGRDGISFRREFVFRDEEGVLLFKGSCFSVLMNLEERSIFREQCVPFGLPEPLEVLMAVAEPSRRIHGDFEGVEEWQVRNSQLDLLGHVNNIRYLEFAYDALNGEERRRFCQEGRLEIYFQAELNPGEGVELLKGLVGDEVLIRGIRKSDGRVSFDCAFSSSEAW